MNKKTITIVAAAGLLAAVGTSSVYGQAGRQQTAIDILNLSAITLNNYHPSGISDPASTALQNMKDTSQCKAAKTSAYSDVGVTSVWLHTGMLTAMKKLKTTYGYSYTVTEIAGGDHSSTSYHYRGTAFDVGTINGSGVSSSNPYWSTFNQRCRDMGSIESLGPGDAGHSTHVHNAWPSGTSASSAGGCVGTTVIVDNSSTGFSVVGTWATGSSSTDKYGSNYRYKSTAPVSEPATWTASLGSTKTYTVSAWWPAGSNRSATAPYIVYHGSGSTTVNKNQQANGGVWNSLGSYSLSAGSNQVKLSCWTTTGFVVVADAIRWQ